MRLNLAAFLSTFALAAAVPAAAESAIDMEQLRGAAGELPAYLECVPYARAQSGIQIFGDAWTWWDKAEGLYQRGNRPQKGAVLAFQPHGNMKLGHVAAVSRVVDGRTVLLSHANWSPIDGQRGQIERDVRAVDVSPANDWSQVRVWYAPLGDLGTTAWPTHGFIYSKASRRTQGVAAAPVAPARSQMSAFFKAPAAPAPVAQPAARTPASVVAAPATTGQKPAAVAMRTGASGFSQAFSGLAHPVPVASVPAARPAARSSGQPDQASAAAAEDIVGDIIRRSQR